MKLRLIAVGRLKTGPERRLIDTYTDRLKSKPAGLGPLLEVETDERKAQTRSQAEAQFEERLSDSERVIALDETGQNLTSREFAQQLARWRDAGCSQVSLLIGAADGLPDSIKKRADLTLSFGKLTWPHLLARAMAAEQLYRAASVISGHPYHRD